MVPPKEFKSEEEIKKHFDKAKKDFRAKQKKEQKILLKKVGKLVCQRPSAIFTSNLEMKLKAEVNYFIGQISEMTVKNLSSFRKGKTPKTLLPKLEKTFEGLGKTIFKQKDQIARSDVSVSFKHALSSLLRMKTQINKKGEHNAD